MPLIAEARAQKLLLVVALIWSVEIFVVQQATCVSEYPLPVFKMLGASGIRFALDILLVSSLLLAVPKKLMPVLFTLSAVFSYGVLVYYDYFARSLSFQVMAHQFGEGGDALKYGALLVNPSWIALLGGLLVAKSTLVWKADSPPRVKMAAAFLLAYVVTLGGANSFVDPLDKLKRFASMDRMGLTYGYLVTWAGEAYYLDPDELRKQAMEQRAIQSDRLSAMERPLALPDHVAVIQVESLDYDILSYEHEGQSPTPYLSSLTQESMYFKVNAHHQNGSADADFILLNNVMPSATVITYKIQGYPYEVTLPRHAGEAGYRTFGFHGNTGQFFDRRSAFSQMGFDGLFFEEEMVQEHGLPRAPWGIQDRDVLSLSNKLFDEAEGKSVHFIITMTSHMPFNFVDEAEQTFRPNPQTKIDNYLNSINYVDRQLQAYVEALPERALVVIYGDHESAAGYAEHQATAGVEYVPLILFQKGENLAAFQQTPLDVARAGGLHTLDIAGYLWSLFEAPPDLPSNDPAEPEAAP